MKVRTIVFIVVMVAATIFEVLCRVRKIGEKKYSTVDSEYYDLNKICY